MFDTNISHSFLIFKVKLIRTWSGPQILGIRLWWFHDIRLLSASDGNSFQWRHQLVLELFSAVCCRDKKGKKNHYFVFWRGGRFTGSENCSASLPRHDLLNDLLHPLSFRVQANFLSEHFQSGTATPRGRGFFRGSSILLLLSCWDPDPYRGLTWSPSLHSGSLGGWSPPLRCGGQWDGSLFWCSGSAVPLRGSSGSSGSFLLGDMAWLQKKKQNQKLQHNTQMQTGQHGQTPKIPKPTIADGEESQEHHKRGEEDSAAHD